MRLLLTLDIDDARADKYNARLFDPKNGDPVLGDGYALVRDVVAGSGVDDILESPGLRRCVTSLTVTLNDEVIDYADWPRRRR